MKSWARTTLGSPRGQADNADLCVGGSKNLCLGINHRYMFGGEQLARGTIFLRHVDRQDDAANIVQNRRECVASRISLLDRGNVACGDTDRHTMARKSIPNICPLTALLKLGYYTNTKRQTGYRFQSQEVDGSPGVECAGKSQRRLS